MSKCTRACEVQMSIWDAFLHCSIPWFLEHCLPLTLKLVRAGQWASVTWWWLYIHHHHSTAVTGTSLHWRCYRYRFPLVLLQVQIFTGVVTGTGYRFPLVLRVQVSTGVVTGSTGAVTGTGFVCMWNLKSRTQVIRIYGRSSLYGPSLQPLHLFWVDKNMYTFVL